MKRIVIIGVIVAVLILAGLAIGLTMRDKNQEEAPQKTEVVKRGNFVVKINASGNLESLLSIEVKSNVEGEIDKLHVQDGDFIEKGQTLVQINDEQIREEMNQAEANVAAASAQLEQAKRSLVIKGKQLDSDLQQQRDNVAQAETSYNVAKATTLQQLSQQQTSIQNTKEAREQDKTALRQAEISLKQAELTLGELEQTQTVVKLDLDNAESELKRTQELYDKKYVTEKSLEDAQASYANARSRYETSQKQLLSQEETVKSQNESINTRERAVQMRKTTLEFEEKNLELLTQTRAAQEQQAQTQLKIAQDRLKQLEDSISDEKDINQFSLESTKANLLRVQSTLKNQRERLGWTTILAPMSGIVINLQVEEGEIVTSGRSAFSQSPPLMVIVDLSQMVVKTFINEVDMEKLSVGKKAEIKILAYPDRTYRGEVREISPSGQSRDNIIYFEVMIAVLGSPKELRPGMTADVDIVVVERENALLLPVEAVKSDRVMIANLTVPEADFAKLAVDQPVEINLGGDSKYAGTVSRHETDAKGPNVEITLTGMIRGVRPGKASANIIMGENTIPNIPAVLRFDKQYSVMLAPEGKTREGTKNGAAKGTKKIIEIGGQSEVDVEIIGGLNEGDRVIIEEIQVAPEQFGGRR